MPSMSIQFGSGIRVQSRSGKDPVSFGFLSDYIAEENKAAYFSVGTRFSNPVEWDYPYIAFEVVGAYFNETIIPPVPDIGQTNPLARNVKDFKIGINANIGFMLKLADRFYLDLGIEMGYTPPRPKHDVLAYYLPGMGASTFGLGKIGFDGGHVQPTFSIKYLIKKDKRIRIREMK